MKWVPGSSTRFSMATADSQASISKMAQQPWTQNWLTLHSIKNQRDKEPLLQISFLQRLPHQEKDLKFQVSIFIIVWTTVTITGLTWRWCHKKSFMILTDSPNALLMDIKTLESPGRVKWEDDLSPISGISHPHTLNDGTMVSICSVLNKDRKPEYLLWKLTPEKPFFR